MAISLIHISDTHNPWHIIKKLQAIKQQYPIDYLLITGDLTNDGDNWQYETVQRALLIYWDYALGWQNMVLPCPGNHDARKAGIFFWQRESIKRFDKTFNTKFYGLNKPMVDVFADGKLVSNVVSNGKSNKKSTNCTVTTNHKSRVVLIRLDSNCEGWNWALACGKVGWYQRWVLSNLLDQYQGYTRIVALHHHPFDRGLGHKMLDAKKFMDVVKGRCEVLCFGHKHRFERCYKQEQEYNIRYILAAGAFFDEPRCHRIVCDNKGLSVNEILI